MIIEVGFSKVFKSTPILLVGKSLKCPTVATTSKPSPRYLEIVLAFVGDSTINNLLDIIVIVKYSTSPVNY